MEYLRIQLKVCEGCGNLFFRATSMDGVYGKCCARRLAEHAKAEPEQRRGRRRQTLHNPAPLALGGAR